MWLQFKEWLAENWAWMGYVVLCLTGAAVGHAKAYEKSDMQWTLKQHLASASIRAIYAVFIGFIMYLICPALGIPPPIAYALTGVMSVFGSETIDWLYRVAKARFEQRLGGKDGDGTNKG